jgi:hypothetical protein
MMTTSLVASEWFEFEYTGNHNLDACLSSWRIHKQQRTKTYPILDTNMQQLEWNEQDPNY